MESADRPPEDQYRCPGESYTISRAIHLGRLVQGYHGCRHCRWASDTAGLSDRQIRLLDEVLARPAAISLFHDEGVRSATIDGLSLEQAQAIGRAFAVCLAEAEESARKDEAQQIVVASDGRAVTAALNAAVCEGVRSSGAAVLDAGPASAACLVRAIEDHQAAGGLLIGTPVGYPSGVGIKFWAGAVPLSQGSFLAQIESRMSEERLSPRYGPLIRLSAASGYLDSLRPLYHALRPLRLVLGTTCDPIVKYLNDLTRNVSCKIAMRDRPLARLAEQIESHQAHFAVEIDDDGESCLVWDERGQAVLPEKLFAWIAMALKAEVVVVESTASAALTDALAAAGVRSVVSDSQRAAMARAMKTQAAMLGGGPSGRIWYAALPGGDTTVAVADALQTMTFMFNLLSRSDRPLSAVVGSS